MSLLPDEDVLSKEIASWKGFTDSLLAEDRMTFLKMLTDCYKYSKATKRLRYYSQFFDTAEMDSSFYEKFYSQMTKGTFIGMARATPENFQFSIKVPETITHLKRLDVNKGAIMSFQEFLPNLLERAQTYIT